MQYSAYKMVPKKYGQRFFIAVWIPRQIRIWFLFCVLSFPWRTSFADTSVVGGLQAEPLVFRIQHAAPLFGDPVAAPPPLNFGLADHALLCELLQ